MSRLLPPLRPVIDVLPSADKDRPGILLRDPFRYTDAILYVPPVWVVALSLLDGRHTVLDVQEALTRATGLLVFSTEIEKFIALLDQQGFLDTEEFARLREHCEAEFREAPERAAIHAGASYPLEPSDLNRTLDAYLERAPQGVVFSTATVGIAAPHVSPEGGIAAYASAYRPLQALPDLGVRTFVILGTSHYGPPQKFGLTQKPFSTPLGTLHVDSGMAEWLGKRGGDAVVREDYCHSIEHSIEFQCVFLQHIFGSGIRILPVLCGPFSDSLTTGAPPEENDGVRRFFDALGELGSVHTGKLFWVLGIDMAHVGRRYGDPFDASANRGRMLEVAEQDRRRIESACASDPEAFFGLVSENGDKLKWCGYSPLYTFLKALPSARGRPLHYEQWNIDEQSVVSFAGLEFRGE